VQALSTFSLKLFPSFSLALSSPNHQSPVPPLLGQSWSSSRLLIRSIGTLTTLQSSIYSLKPFSYSQRLFDFTDIQIKFFLDLLFCTIYKFLITFKTKMPPSYETPA